MAGRARSSWSNSACFSQPLPEDGSAGSLPLPSRAFQVASQPLDTPGGAARPAGYREVHPEAGVAEDEGGSSPVRRQPRDRRVSPAPTTIRQPWDRIGAAMVRVLPAQIGGEETAAVILPTESVKRASA